VFADPLLMAESDTTFPSVTSLDETRSTGPLRAAAWIFGVLGVFPLAALIKWAPVVRWLPRAGVEYLVSITVALAVCLLAARSAAMHRALDRIRRTIMAIEPDVFAVWLFVITAIGAIAVAWYISALHPVAGDEMSQRFQARLLDSGHLSAAAESSFEFFSGIQTVSAGGRWFSQFPIGGPMVLALGGLIGMPWLVNPLLGGWTAALLYRYTAATVNEQTARVAGILFVTSPFILLMSGTQMNHVGSLAFMMLALSRLPILLATDDRRTQLRAAAIIGFGVAMSALFRPYDAALFGAVIGAFVLFVENGRRRNSVAAMIAGGLLPIAFLLFVNWKQTGHPFLFGYDALNGAAHRPGFHRDPAGNQFTPLQGLHHVSAYLLLLNVSLFEGPLPAVALIVASLALLPRANRWDYLNTALLIVLVAGYAAYWAESFLYGPRFLYIGVPLFVLLVARLPEALGRFNTGFSRFILPVMLALAWVQPRVARYQGVASSVGAIRAGRPDRLINLEKEIQSAGLEDALVFVHESWHGRLTARLRAIGAPALTAERIVGEFDACALQNGLDTEELVPGPPASKERWNRVVRRALMAGQAQQVIAPDGTAIALANGRLHPACTDDWLSDRSGTMTFDPFLMYETFDAEGRLAGNVVFARDFGARNSRLLSRFGDRSWYRYRPRTGPNDYEPVFIPYRER
jgi:hypothetical protein